MLNRRNLIKMAALFPAFNSFKAWPSIHIDPAYVYEQQTGGRVGLYAENIITGKKLAWRAQELFVMCSTFKFSLAALALAQADKGTLRLDDQISYGRNDIAEYAPAALKNLERGSMSIKDMCQASVELSDNTCANLVLARVGGPSALTAFWRETGDTTSRLDHNEPLLNRSPPGDPHDATTPGAMAGNVRRFVLGDVLKDTSRQLLTEWIVGSKTGADRLRAGLPADWRIGDKTGNNGKDAFGDIAIAWPSPSRPLLMCVYTQGGNPTPAQVTTVFSDIGRLVSRQLI